MAVASTSESERKKTPSPQWARFPPGLLFLLLSPTSAVEIAGGSLSLSKLVGSDDQADIDNQEMKVNALQFGVINEEEQVPSYLARLSEPTN